MNEAMAYVYNMKAWLQISTFGFMSFMGMTSLKNLRKLQFWTESLDPSYCMLEF